jgi:hypothetical protein
MRRLPYRRHYDVDVVVTSFDVPLWEALALVRSSNVMIGMHGAALTNALALRPVSLPFATLYCSIVIKLNGHTLFLVSAEHNILTGHVGV